MIAVRPLGVESARAVAEERKSYRAHLESAAERVRPLLRAVRQEGDEALRRLGKDLDGYSGPIRVPTDLWERADARTPREVRQALSLAAERIRLFHTAQHAPTIERTLPGGSKLTLRFRPVARVGAYAPGGRFPYPSTVLMTAVPAKVAGATEVFLATPPRKDEKEGLSPVVATAARIAGVDRIFLLGGALAAGALAYGTATVPRVDKLVGPGNRYFTAAKKEVLGEVGIDSLAGPSESMLVFDRSAPFELMLRESLAQIEHGEDSRSRVVVLGGGLAEVFARRLEQELPTPEAARQVDVWVARDLAEARRFAESVAPESLVACFEDSSSWERDPPPCGAFFVGPWGSVALADYVTGTNHVLPVQGSARFAGGLSTYDFGRWLSVQKLTSADAVSLAPSGATLAEAEGMRAHADAIRSRARPIPPNPSELTSGASPSPPVPSAGARRPEGRRRARGR